MTTSVDGLHMLRNDESCMFAVFGGRRYHAMQAVFPGETNGKGDLQRIGGAVRRV